METAVPVIETRGRIKTYARVLALQALDLKVPQDSTCGFLGSNASGKTTTIKLLLGLARPASAIGKVISLSGRPRRCRPNRSGGHWGNARSEEGAVGNCNGDSAYPIGCQMMLYFSREEPSVNEECQCFISIHEEGVLP